MGVVKNVKCRVPSLVKKTIAVGERSFLFLSGTNVPLFQRFFFFGWCGLELAQFERLCVCVRTTGGEECLKKYTSLGTRDSIVL